MSTSDSGPPEENPYLDLFHELVRRGQDASEHLEFCLSSFLETGNPMYAWAGVFAAVRGGGPLPEWVAVYLEKVSLALTTRLGEGEHRGNQRVLEALGFRVTPGKDDYAEFHHAQDSFVRGFALRLEMDRSGRSAKPSSEELGARAEAQLIPLGDADCLASGDAQSFTRGERWWRSELDRLFKKPGVS